jgi:cytochrome P450
MAIPTTQSHGHRTWTNSSLLTHHDRNISQLTSSPQPMMRHSLLLGHLPVIAKLFKESNTPSDIHMNILPLLIARNWRSLFPSESRCPPVFYVDTWPMGPPQITPIEPSVAAQIITHPKLPKSHDAARWLFPITQNLDMVSASGRQWRVWRTRFSAGFSAKNVTALAPAMVDEVATFAEKVRGMAGEGGGWGDVFPLEDMATNLTVDVIGRAALDVELKAQTEGPGELQMALIDQMNLTMIWINLVNVWRFLSPWRLWKLLKNHRTMRKALLPCILKRLEAHMSTSVAHTGRPKTIVDMAIQAYTDEARDGGREAEFDDSFFDNVMAQLKVFMFAGHDTTATTICWMLHLLADNPTAMERLRREHEEVLGPKDGLLDKIRNAPQILNTLPWTTAIVKETLRVYPVVGSIRDGHADVSFSIPDSPVRWPTLGPEYFIMDAILPNMHSEDVWPEPERFMPERWMTTDADDPLHPPKNAWRPFGMGPRNCIGQELAMMELRLVLVLLARDIDIECAWEEWDEKRWVFRKPKRTHVADIQPAAETQIRRRLTAIAVTNSAAVAFRMSRGACPSMFGRCRDRGGRAEAKVAISTTRVQKFKSAITVSSWAAPAVLP